MEKVNATLDWCREQIAAWPLTSVGIAFALGAVLL